jgi:hypothetical protein
MEHKFLRLFVNGKWTGNPDRTITIKKGSEYVIVDMDEYAKEHGIELPTGPTAPKKPKNKKKDDVEVNSNADMGTKHHEGHTEESGE